MVTVVMALMKKTAKKKKAGPADDELLPGEEPETEEGEAPGSAVKDEG